jgi:LysR family transcriptional regulator, regulator for bpeEF and oprC
MDKLRAIEYFNRAVEAGSFAAAAKRLDVTRPAVTQLIGALERSLGFKLFHRTTRGLSLTADGERYYEVSLKVAADLQVIEQRLGPRGSKPRGTLTVGMRQNIAQQCVMPRIARFLARFPDVEVVTRPVGMVEDIDRQDLDLSVLVGWPPELDLVIRPLAQSRYVVCASPEYWLREGTPRSPEDLGRHSCLVYRGMVEVVLDRWTFEKDGVRCSVDVKSRLCSDDRTWLDDAACAGTGVIRAGDLFLSHHLQSGALVPVLTDWTCLDAPMVFAAYRPSQRASKLVRVFIEFLVEIFDELERERWPAPMAGIQHVSKPAWFSRAHGRHSAYVARGSRRG